MTRIACIVAATAAAITATAADVLAASRNEHRRSSSHHASRTGTVTYAPARTVVAAYAPAYRPSSYTASRQSPSPSRSSTPPVYFVPALSPNAPPFSFSESEAQPGWNWQRVSLQQIDAEVRAKRAAQDPARTPPLRQYCPDSRAYFPEVTQCASEWLNVVGKAPAGPAAQTGDSK